MNSNFLFDQTFRRVQAQARRFYFKILDPWDPFVPTLDKEKINFSRIGWGHLHKNTRSKLEMLSRYFALPKVVAILSSKTTRVEVEKGGDGVSEFWSLYGTVDGVLVKVVVRSYKGGGKHFYSVIWKGEGKKKESKEKRAVSRLYPRCRGVVTSQLLSSSIISEVMNLSSVSSGRG